MSEWSVEEAKIAAWRAPIGSPKGEHGMNDDVKAAAERLIEEAAIHIEAVVSGGHDPLTDDILTVARYALEAGREVARMREELEKAELKTLYVDHTLWENIPILVCRLCPASILLSERHEKRVEHEPECPFATLATPGEPEGSGGG